MQNSRSVIVMDFPPSMDADSLTQLFAEKNLHARVRITKVEVEPKRVALAIFDYEREARRAVEVFNFFDLNPLPSGRSRNILRVTRFDSGEELLRREGDVFVKLLRGEENPKNSERTFLRSALEEHQYLDMKLHDHPEEAPEGGSCTHVLIQFEDEEGARKAIASLKEKPTDGFSEIKVCPYLSTTQFNANNLSVQNFGAYFSEESLVKEFSKFGEVVSSMVNQKRDQAYVCFSKLGQSKKAMEEMNGKILPNGRTLRVQSRYFSSNKERKNIVVFGLQQETDDASLIEKFASFGVIVTAKVDTRERSRLIGYVNFDSAEAAKAAEEAHSGKEGLTVCICK